MAVCANVGIPLGIVVAPTERREVVDLFASCLADRGFSRNEFYNLPLLSDEGTALNASAMDHH
jgi:hypothetical protein